MGDSCYLLDSSGETLKQSNQKRVHVQVGNYGRLFSLGKTPTSFPSEYFHKML